MKQGFWEKIRQDWRPNTFYTLSSCHKLQDFPVDSRTLAHHTVAISVFFEAEGNQTICTSTRCSEHPDNFFQHLHNAKPAVLWPNYLENLLQASKDSYQHFILKIQGSILQLCGWEGDIEGAVQKTGCFANKFLSYYCSFLFSMGHILYVFKAHTHFHCHPHNHCVKSVSLVKRYLRQWRWVWMVNKKLHLVGGTTWTWDMSMTRTPRVHLNLRHETQYVPFKFLNVYIMQKTMCHNVTAKI